MREQFGRKGHNRGQVQTKDMEMEGVMRKPEKIQLREKEVQMKVPIRKKERGARCLDRFLKVMVCFPFVVWYYVKVSRRLD